LENFSRFEAAEASEILSWAIDTFGDSFAIATSFQKEGMVILDLASRISAGVRVFTLDTGRLPDETYRMMETVRQRYGVAVEIVFPEREDVEQSTDRTCFIPACRRGNGAATRARCVPWSANWQP